MSDKSGLWVLLGIGALALGVLWLTRKPARIQSTSVERKFVPVRRYRDSEGELSTPVGRKYINKEIVDITWNADGFPVKIVTERAATQS